MNISVIIPTYCRAQDLTRLLASLESESSEGVEIIVVNQSPSSGDALQATNPLSNLRVVTQTFPSLPAARNLGIRESSADIILFLDDDTEVLSGCIQSHLILHRKHTAAIIAGRSIMAGSIPWADISEPAYIDPRTGETRGNFDLENACMARYAAGCHFSVKRSILSRSGLFDERLRGNALYEDVDFSLRVTRAGGSILYCPEPVVKHFVSNTGGCRSEDRERYLLNRIHNHTLFYFRHIRHLPTMEYVRYMRNIAESLSRNQNTHNPALLIQAAIHMMQGYLAAFLPIAGSHR